MTFEIPFLPFSQDRKGSLKIFSSESNWKTYCYKIKTFNNPESDEPALKPLGSDDDLEMDSLTPIQIQFLGSSFSNIEVLVLVLDELSPFVLELLRQWPALKSLTLFGSCEKLYVKELYKAIGSLNQLKHLSVICSDLYYLIKNLFKLKPVLRNLSHISLSFNKAPVANLRLISLCTSPTSLRIKFESEWRTLSAKAFQQHLLPHLFDHVTTLVIDKICLYFFEEHANDKFQIFAFICDRFLNLQQLSVHVWTFEDTEEEAKVFFENLNLRS